MYYYRAPARHRAWDIPELVQLICEEAEHLPPAKTAKGPRLRPIAALAQINRAFWTLAAPCLWRKQMSLIPLLKCLPADAWEQRVVDDRLTFVRVREPLLSAHAHNTFDSGLLDHSHRMIVIDSMSMDPSSRVLTPPRHRTSLWCIGRCTAC